MSNEMKTIIYIFSFIIFSISCNSDFSPLSDFHIDYEVMIQSTGNSQADFIEFKFNNTISDTLLYWGYDKYSPFYTIQIKADSGWVNYGGWCGTGAKLFQFDPFESFNVYVHTPRSHKPWRVGLYTTSKSWQYGKFSWSVIQY
jgi:hypothetical protein